MTDENSTIELSKREQEVLELVATGASNKEIAQQLVISVNTVKVHVRKILEKLDVQSRTEATLLAIQKNLVAVPAAEPDTESAEPLSPTNRTFLLTPTPALTLPQWQQFYLLGALLLALAVAAIPLLPRSQPRTVPDLPVIYAQAPPPTPPTNQSNNPHDSWTPHPAMPTERAGLALAAVGEKLFAIGGVRDNNKATRSVEIYDTVGRSWSEGAAKPTAATNILGVPVEGQIYVPGGCTNDGAALDVLEIYNPQTDSWSSGPPLPAPRCGYGLAGHSGQLYLFGGWNGVTFEDTIFVFNPPTNTWATAGQTLPQPLGFMGVASLNNLIYLVGGYNGEAEFAQTYTFDPAAGVWAEKAPLQEARGGLGLIQGGSSLYAIGGGWKHASTTSEKYDPQTDQWAAFDTPVTGQWRNLGLTSIDTAIYAVGGWDGDTETYLDTVTSYQFLFQLFLPLSASGDPGSSN